MQSAHIKGMILTAVAGITFRTVDLAPSNVNEGLSPRSAWSVRLFYLRLCLPSEVRIFREHFKMPKWRRIGLLRPRVWHSLILRLSERNKDSFTCILCIFITASIIAPCFIGFFVPITIEFTTIDIVALLYLSFMTILIYTLSFHFISSKTAVTITYGLCVGGVCRSWAHPMLGFCRSFTHHFRSSMGFVRGN